MRTRDEVGGCVSKGQVQKRSTVAAVVLGAFSIDTDGVRVIHESVERRIISREENGKRTAKLTHSCSS